MNARVRVRFAKLGKVRWTSHRDLARMWERAFRRIRLPLAYTSGFSPRPRVSFGLALPTGHESVAEYLDLDLAEEGVDLAALPDRLSAALPDGVDATVAAPVEPGTPSLQEDVVACTWEWTLRRPDGTALDAASVGERVAALLDASELVVTRTRKGNAVTDDIRPDVLSLALLTPPGGVDGTEVRLRADLARATRTLRPAEVAAALDPSLELGTVCRLHQWILRHGAWEEPLAVAGSPGATTAPHACERAS